MPRAGVFWKQYREVRSGLLPRPPARCGCCPCARLPPPAAARRAPGRPGAGRSWIAPPRRSGERSRALGFPLLPNCVWAPSPRALVTLDPGAEPWHHDSEADTLSWSHPGNAGYRLPLPASFPAGLPLGEQPPEGQWQHHRAEIQIARKLQSIADQFHRLQMQQHQQNRNRMWWQFLLFLHNLALNGDENRNGAGPR
ncbi:bcl-2-modifying factor isoform X2 [Myotis daubentonii]|uniref:bcl-2-modifying factor isoform X2 n=1 Tax=Myotis daubentonii TaxID=98922 RepID=UPI0028730CA9|nr:bcl-2-modifying factor isoform X2 [Myotis daubentonii]